MSVLRIFMFGGLRILLDDEYLPPFPTRKTRSLFAYLVTYRHHRHTRRRLAGLFWGDKSEDRAQRNLNTTLWRLRRIVPPHYLSVGETTLAFNTQAPYWLDIEQFEEALARARGEDAASMAHLRTACELYRGEFLQGMYDDWMLVETERLRLSYQRALQRLFSYHKKGKQWEQALAVGQQLLALDPLREDIHLGMMKIYQHLGRRTAALAQYERCRQVLQAELAINPLPETRALYQELLATPEAVFASDQSPPQHVWPARRGRTLFDDFGQAPWVGRERELALIEQRLARLQTGAGGMLLVGGEAGVGKTRLAEQAAALAVTMGVTPLWGICPDLQEPPPYQSLIEMLQEGLAKLHIPTASPSPWLDELAVLLPGLRPHFYRTPPSEPDDVFQRSRLLPSIWRLLRHFAASSPVLLILDDLHWADPATLEALRYLLPHLRSAPVFFLITFRPEELPGRAAVAQTLLSLDASDLSERIDLTPLSATETAQLLQRVLGLSQPHPVLGPLIYKETEGNPFFIGEVLKALVEEDLLTLDPVHGWRTPWDRDAAESGQPQLPMVLPLPRGIRRLVVHRLARLSPLAQNILAQLAVLGREVDFELLFRFCQEEDERLLVATDELLHRHLLIETEKGLRFSHDKIRQTVYGGLSRTRRRLLHRRAGETLAAISPERVEELAHHFRQAGDDPHTLDYALAAGDRARHLYANAAALTYYAWAIEAASRLDNPPARLALIQAHEQRGRIYRQLSEMNKAVAEYQAMLAAAEQADDHIAQARAVRLAGWIRGNLQGDWDLGLQEAQRAQRLAQEVHDQREQAAALRDIGAYHNLKGNYDQALTALRGALQRFRHLQDPRGEAATLQYLAVSYHFLGRHNDATRAYQGALALWQQLGDRLAETKVLANLGYLQISDGRLSAAMASFAQAERVLQAIEATAVRAWVQIGMAAVTRYQGDYRACLRRLDALMTRDEALVDTDYLRALVAHHQGMARWHSGELSAGLLALQKALDLAQRSDTPSLIAGIYTDLGRCWRQLGDIAQAWELHRTALTLLEAESFSPPVATLRSELAWDWLLLGKMDEGRALLQRTVAVVADLPHWHRAEVLLNQAAGLLLFPPEEATLAAAHEALTAAETLGVCAMQVQGHLLMARAWAGQGCWAEAEAQLQKGLDSLAPEQTSLARCILLTLLVRVQLASGRKDAAAHTYAIAQSTCTAIAASLAQPTLRRRWRSQLNNVETHMAGVAPGRRICVFLPRTDAPKVRVAVVWTPDAGPEDEASARDKVALRQQRLRRLLHEAARQGALAPEADLAAALGVSVRTIKRDMAALRNRAEAEEIQAAAPCIVNEC